MPKVSKLSAAGGDAGVAGDDVAVGLAAAADPVDLEVQVAPEGPEAAAETRRRT
jgi:hypothetical protein